MQKTIVLRQLLYRYEDAAALLSLSRISLRNLIDEGKLVRIYVLRRSSRITVESMAEYLQSLGVKVLLTELAIHAAVMTKEMAHPRSTNPRN